MRKNLLFFLGILVLGTVVQGQVNIDETDMPATGDTLRVSMTNNVPEGYYRTGRDTTWDFSLLEALSQRLDSFVSPTVTPLEYWLFFIPNIQTNLASPRPGGLIPGLSITDSYRFYKKSATAFTDLGFAMKIEGIPVPLKYNNPDIYYKLPFTIDSTWSSESSFTASLPGFGYYSSQRNRNNLADGWGALTTPFGTFPAVRVKSEILIHDSIYIDSLGIGFPFNRFITEYKWLGKGKGIPLLTIIEEGSNVIAEYRDIPRLPVIPFSVDLGSDTTVNKGDTLTIIAHVIGGTPPVQVFWNTLDTGLVLTVAFDNTDTITAIAVDAMLNFTTDQKIVTVINPGIEERNGERLCIYPSPAKEKITIELPALSGNTRLSIINVNGVEFIRRPITEPKTKIDVSNLPTGVYFIRVQNDRTIEVGKIVKQ